MNKQSGSFSKTGVLLINLGTPQELTVKSVKAYLHEFLSDPKVIDLPTPFRQLLVYGLIVPRRAQQSTHAYAQIWTKEGSPLLTYSLALKTELQNNLGENYCVALGMNYGQPMISDALKTLIDNQCQEMIVLPLFPQYSSAVTESILVKVAKEVAAQKIKLPIKIIKDFFNDQNFIASLAKPIQKTLDQVEPEYLLFSYHGLPMRQLYKTSNDFCKSCSIQNACAPIQDKNRDCYRAQCYETSAQLSAALSLGKTQVLTTFQSRLGRLTWTQPYTDKVLEELAAQGVKKIAVACPSFVTDCLETLEEIGIRAKQTWQDLGGSEFTLISGLNADASWAASLIKKSQSNPARL